MSAAELACLDQACHALLRGNVPVGAAILDAAESLIAADLFGLAERQRPWAEVVGALLAAV